MVLKFLVWGVGGVVCEGRILGVGYRLRKFEMFVKDLSVNVN